MQNCFMEGDTQEPLKGIDLNLKMTLKFCLSKANVYITSLSS